jgi:hypothetical protein
MEATMISKRLLLAVLCPLALTFAACGGADSTYQIPAESGVKSFQAPDPDDLVDEEEHEAADDGDDEGDDDGDEVGGAAGAPSALAPIVTLGKDDALEGSLTKGQIQDSIRANLNQLRFCYEKELRKDPQLAGKVTVKFTIGNAGKVTEARAEGMGAEVAACVTQAVKAIAFPKPKGGGIVNVTYPFIFKTEG